jgi:glycosyltransferase involved in cell wall biosynthesis
MISLVICSRNAHSLATVCRSVEATIGVPYELIAIDNSQGQYGICEAYNVGAQKANFGVICFMHEDIQFLTPNWGMKVLSHFQDETIGVLGVAGSTYLPVAPCPWWEAGEGNIRAQILHTSGNVKEERMYYNPGAESLSDVAVVDGVWICARKKLWEQHPFDQHTFPEFHFYDIDFCTEARKVARVCVTFEVLIEHFSYGSMNNSWTKNALIYYKKRKQLFPIGTTHYSGPEVKRINIKGYISFIYRLKALNVKRKTITKYLIKLLSLDPLHKDSLYQVKELMKNC